LGSGVVFFQQKIWSTWLRQVRIFYAKGIKRHAKRERERCTSACCGQRAKYSFRQNVTQQKTTTLHEATAPKCLRYETSNLSKHTCYKMCFVTYMKCTEKNNQHPPMDHTLLWSRSSTKKPVHCHYRRLGPLIHFTSTQPSVGRLSRRNRMDHWAP
jgi:hypothetical protein